jgi:regulator of sirC expression with transglutaminase-like and TPR domain
VDPTARFAELVNRPEVPLDEAAFVLSAHDHEVDIAARLGQLDDLAASCPGGTLEDLLEHLFERHGFAGDADDYYSPVNSYLDLVLERGLGIPITLSVLTIEVGRRMGLGLHGVGFPAHFMVGTADGRFVDAFGGGALLDRSGTQARLEQLGVDPGMTLDVQAVPPTLILRRMLTNLGVVFRQERRMPSMVWVLQLRTLLPEADSDDTRALAAGLAANGQLEAASDLLRALPDPTREDRETARRLRARLN